MTTKQVRTNARTRGTTAPPVSLAELRPALADIPTAIEYLGGIGRSKFYADLLPRLDVVRIDRRIFVTVASLDRLIAERRQPGAA